MPVSSLLWGTNFENVVTIGYPIYSVLSDREEREGSMHIQGPSGQEDSWIVGRDYVMDAEVRWIPDGPGTNPVQTQLSGSVSWQEFLDWARDANAFRFVPDASVPGFYVDNVYLVEPRKGFGSLSADIKRNVKIKLRNATKDFHEALRGVMFEYQPGTDVTQPVAYTMTRSTTGTRRGLPGSLAAAIGASDLASVVRDRHYEGSQRTALLEAQRGQIVPDPENFGNWSLQGTLARTSGQADPFGGTGAYLIDSNTPAGTDAIFEAVPYTGNANKAHAVFARQGSSGTSDILCFDFTASVERCRIRLTWTNGVPVAAVQNGAGTIHFTVNWGGGWWLVGFTANAIVAANTNRVLLYPDPVGGGGTTYFFGANAWDQVFPASYQGPTITSRSSDTFSRALGSQEQPIFFHRKWIERGPGIGIGGFNARSGIGNAAYAGSRLHFIAADVGGYYFERYNAVGTNRSSGNTPAAAWGDIWEMLGVLNVDGSVQARYIRNGGVETAFAASAALALDGYWGTSPGDAIVVTPAGTGGVSSYADALIFEKVGPLIFGGVTRNTIPLARAA